MSPASGQAANVRDPVAEAERINRALIASQRPATTGAYATHLKKWEVCCFAFQLSALLARFSRHISKGVCKVLSCMAGYCPWQSSSSLGIVVINVKLAGLKELDGALSCSGTSR